MLGKDDYAIFPAEIAQEFQVMDRSIMASGQRLTFEENITTLSGEKLIMLVTKGPVFDAHGRISGIFGISHDITQRKRNEEQLQQAATVFETTREGVLVTDPQRRILLVNRALCEISGYSEADLLGNTPSVLSSGHHDAEFFEDVWSCIEASGHWQW